MFKFQENYTYAIGLPINFKGKANYEAWQVNSDVFELFDNMDQDGKVSNFTAALEQNLETFLEFNQTLVSEMKFKNEKNQSKMNQIS